MLGINFIGGKETLPRLVLTRRVLLSNAPPPRPFRSRGMGIRIKRVSATQGQIQTGVAIPSIALSVIAPK